MYRPDSLPLENTPFVVDAAQAEIEGQKLARHCGNTKYSKIFKAAGDPGTVFESTAHELSVIGGNKYDSLLGYLHGQMEAYTGHISLEMSYEDNVEKFKKGKGQYIAFPEEGGMVDSGIMNRSRDLTMGSGSARQVDDVAIFTNALKGKRFILFALDDQEAVDTVQPDNDLQQSGMNNQSQGADNVTDAAPAMDAAELDGLDVAFVEVASMPEAANDTLSLEDLPLMAETLDATDALAVDADIAELEVSLFESEALEIDDSLTMDAEALEAEALSVDHEDVPFAVDEELVIDTDRELGAEVQELEVDTSEALALDVLETQDVDVDAVLATDDPEMDILTVDASEITVAPDVDMDAETALETPTLEVLEAPAAEELPADILGTDHTLEVIERDDAFPDVESAERDVAVTAPEAYDMRVEEASLPSAANDDTALSAFEAEASVTSHRNVLPTDLPGFAFGFEDNAVSFGTMAPQATTYTRDESFANIVSPYAAEPATIDATSVAYEAPATAIITDNAPIQSAQSEIVVPVVAAPSHVEITDAVPDNTPAPPAPAANDQGPATLTKPPVLEIVQPTQSSAAPVQPVTEMPVAEAPVDTTAAAQIDVSHAVVAEAAPAPLVAEQTTVTAKPADTAPETASGEVKAAPVQTPTQDFTDTTPTAEAIQASLKVEAPAPETNERPQLDTDRRDQPDHPGGGGPSNPEIYDRGPEIIPPSNPDISGEEGSKEPEKKAEEAFVQDDVEENVTPENKGPQDNEQLEVVPEDYIAPHQPPEIPPPPPPPPEEDVKEDPCIKCKRKGMPGSCCDPFNAQTAEGAAAAEAPPPVIIPEGHKDLGVFGGVVQERTAEEQMAFDARRAKFLAKNNPALKAA